MSEVERRRRGGSLFIGGPLLVRGVVRALSRPALFPDGPAVAASLARRQARAAAWLLLRTALEAALARAQDSYLYEQSTAIQEALDVVQSYSRPARRQASWQSPLRTSEQPAGPDLLTSQRRLALAAPLLILEKRQQKKHRVFLANRRLHGKPPPESKKGAPAKTLAEIAQSIATLYNRRLHRQPPGSR